MTVTITAEQKEFKYNSYQNKSLKNAFQTSYLTQVTQKNSKLNCFASCSKILACGSLMYNRLTKQCSFYSKRLTNVDMNDIAIQNNFVLGFKTN